jgi:hypothetical protein
MGNVKVEKLGIGKIKATAEAGWSQSRYDTQNDGLCHL